MKLLRHTIRSVRLIIGPLWCGQQLMLMVFLVESDFVGSALLRESINSSIGDDDKLYFFFTERNTEPTAYSSQTKVARVARVCKVKFGIYFEDEQLWVHLYFSYLVFKFALTRNFRS